MSSHLVAVGFLKENDHFCQNQTMRAANDVCLRTTTPLPVAYELNERTGSQDRKSKQKERRKYCSQTNSLEGERDSGKTLHQKFHESLSNSETTLYILPCLACVPMFLAAVNTFSEKVSWFTSVEKHTVQWRERDFYVKGSPKRFPKHCKICDLIYLSMYLSLA